MTTEAGSGSQSGNDLWGKKTKAATVKERIYRILLAACAYISIFTTVGIVFILFFESAKFFREVSIIEFFTTTTWRPTFADPKYGILPLIGGTLLTTVIAAAVAIPLGVLAAIYLSEYAPPRLRGILKPALEVLAGVPTIVYGFFALTFVTPLLKATILPNISGFNALSAGLVMGIMIIPTVASVSEDTIYAVPRGLRESGYALGATKFEVSTRIVVPAALSGIVAAFVLGLSRAIGETMIMAVAAGNLANLTANPLKSVQTMTAYIVQVSSGETAQGTITYQTIFAVGATLFLMTLVLNIISHLIVRRYKEGYE
ncbi:phosphate ABC transporter permease subunit PstC [soil metagenome]